MKTLCQALDITLADLFEGEKLPLPEDSEGADAKILAVKGAGAKSQEAAVPWAKDPETASDTALFASAGKKKLPRRALGVCFLCAAVFMGGVLLWQQRQPLDFQKGNFEIGKIAFCQAGRPEVQEEDFQKAAFQVEGEFADEDENQLKGLLAGLSRREETEKLKHFLEEIPVKIEGVGTFYWEGYEDERSGKLFAYNYADYQRIYDLCEHLREDRNYAYGGKTSWRYGKGRGRILCEIKTRAEEAAARYYLDQLKDFEPIEEFPDAYIKSLDIVKIRRLKAPEYKELEQFERIEKELAYYEPCDFRIYQVTTDLVYTEQMRALGPQNPDGRREAILLVADKNWGEGYDAVRI